MRIKVPELRASTMFVGSGVWRMPTPVMRAVFVSYSTLAPKVRTASRVARVSSAGR
jgi:hypothetical protein